MSLPKEVVKPTMKVYVGTKTINASPMTKKEYCDYRGWSVPEDEDPNDKVYLVEYLPHPDDGVNANHDLHEGYISMSPAPVFERAYRLASTVYDRLIIERTDLEKKIYKLEKAIEQTEIPLESLELAIKQMDAMIDYLNILNIRLVKSKV